MPDNFKPTDPNNPYADYGAPNLYAFVAKRGVAKPGNPSFLYSNLGFGLLGQALGVHSGMSYAVLLKEEVIDPLGLRDTTVSLSPAQQARFIAGHDEHHHPAHAWDLDAFAGAGAIRSTAADMLTYLEANLHPEKLKPVAGSSAGARCRRLSFSRISFARTRRRERALLSRGSLSVKPETIGTTAPLVDTAPTHSSIPRRTTPPSCCQTPR
jgi:CubicO group peptidase (beta-lactamase class C family)